MLTHGQIRARGLSGNDVCNIDAKEMVDIIEAQESLLAMMLSKPE